MALKVTIHTTGSGVCALTGREADGLNLTFEDGTVQNAFLSWKAFRQLAGLRFEQLQSADGKSAKSASPPVTVDRK